MPNASGRVSPRSWRCQPRSLPRNHDAVPRQLGAFWRHNSGDQRGKNKRRRHGWTSGVRHTFGAPSAWLFLVRVHACRAGLRFTRPGRYRSFAPCGIRKSTVMEGSCAKQGGPGCIESSRPVRSVRRRTEASGTSVLRVLQTIDRCGTLILGCTPTPQVLTSTAWIARPHGDPASNQRYGFCFTNCWLPGRRAKPTN